MSQPPPSDSNSKLNPKIDIQNSEKVTIAEGDGNIQGDKNQAVSGDGNRVNQAKRDSYQAETINVIQAISAQPARAAATQKRPANEQTLLMAVATEVDDRLQQSLHEAVFVTLPKVNQRDRVRRPWDGEVKIGVGEKQPLPDGQSVYELFRQRTVGGKLLILGEPGSGKTTTLLDLARQLIRAAQDDPDAPIPVLFNLSSWAGVTAASKTDTIGQWMVGELKLKYGVSQKLGEEWLAKRKLLPLLDGLDEVAAGRQADCLHGINRFLQGETAAATLAVCCREEEYNQLVDVAGDRLHLNGAICLKPLSNEQVESYLVGLGCGELWQTVRSDAELLGLIQTPLWLSLSVLAQQALDLAAWGREPSLEKRRDQLLDAYVGRMLHDAPVGSKAYEGKGLTEPSARQTRVWLVWLAQRLQEASQDEFLIEGIQPSYLDQEQQKILHVLEMVFATVYYFMFYWWFDWNLMYVVLIVLGLAAFAYSILLKKSVLRTEFPYNMDEPSENLFWSLRKSLNIIFEARWIYKLFAPIFCILLFTISMYSLKLKFINNIEVQSFPQIVVGSIAGTIFFLILILILYIVYGIIEGLEFASIEAKMAPNQGIWFALRNAIMLFAFTYVICTIVFFGLLSTFDRDQTLASALRVGLILALSVELLFSPYLLKKFRLFEVILHFALRLILYTSGHIPWNYARFLNYSTDRLLLQRVGGRYRFIHKLVQEHFAAMS